MHRRDFFLLMASLPLAARVANALPDGYSKLVYPDKSGRLIYTPDENGNTIPDFSNCGYRGGGLKLPDAPVKAIVEPADGDAQQRIQAAIDRVAALPAAPDGLRGAVLIKRGKYKVGGPIKIGTSGVVLRGEGQDENGTVLIATLRKQHALIEIAGAAFGKPSGPPQRIIGDYVPVGTHTLKLDSIKPFKIGDRVVVRRIGNKDWIHQIAMDRITPRASGGTVQWTPFNLDYERTVTDIKGDTISIDAPIVCAVEQRWGGGEVYLQDATGRISNIGVEDLRSDSEFDPNVTDKDDDGDKYASDEEHAWSFIRITNAENVWVRKITAVHFGYSAVEIAAAKWVTVEDSKCLDMISQITGSRRYAFNIEAGQQCLIQRCEVETARHSFVVGGRVCGPNVFLDCKATEQYATSEPHHRWSTGGLYDNVSADIAIQDRQWMGSGHGWAGANYVVWNCEGPLVCQSPPTAHNWAIGQIGEKQPGAFAPRPDGYWESLGKHVLPRSLYLQQLRDRLGERPIKNVS
jgi:hypothetical protein